MQPGATEILNGVKNIILNTLLPELQTEQARQQAMYTSVLLDHLSARWDIEVPLLREEHAELRTLLAQAAAVIGDPQLREAVAASVEVPAWPQALAGENERLRRLVPALTRALPPRADPRVLDLEAAIRAYLRNQHRRDEAIVQVGALGW